MEIPNDDRRRIDHDFDDIQQRLADGETLSSIAKSKGMTQGNLSNWMRPRLKSRGLYKEVRTQFKPLEPDE